MKNQKVIKRIVGYGILLILLFVQVFIFKNMEFKQVFQPVIAIVLGDAGLAMVNRRKAKLLEKDGNDD